MSDRLNLRFPCNRPALLLAAMLCLASPVAAQYLEHWIPFANPAAAGAVMYPSDLVYSATSDKFYAYGLMGWVAVIAGRDHRIIKDVPVQRPECWGLARSVWSWRNNKAYFRDMHGVAVVNCLTDSIEADIPVGRWGAAGIAFDDSNNCLAVASPDSSSVLLIDGVTNNVRSRLSTTRRPYQVTWDSRDNRYFVLQTKFSGYPDTAFITVFNAATGAVLDSFPLATVSAAQPEMAYLPASNKVYVPCESCVVAIDSRTFQILKYIPCQAGRFCWNSVHNRLYCVAESTVVIECAQDTIIGSIPAGFGLRYSGFAVAYDSIDDRLFLPDGQYDSDSLCIVDGNSNAVLARLPLQPGPGRLVTAMAWTACDDRVLVTVWPDMVYAIDAQANCYSDSVQTYREMDGLIFNPLVNKLHIKSYLAANSMGLDGRVLGFDCNSNRFTDWTAVGAGEQDMVLAEAGAKLYCACELDSLIGVVDCASGALLKTFPASYPTSLAHDSSRHRVFCVDWHLSGSGNLLVFDSRADTLLATIAVPLPDPWFVTWFPTVNKVYVQDFGGRLAVLDGDSLQFLHYIPFSGRPGTAPCCNPEDNKLYTGNCNGTPGLVIIDALRDSVVARLDSFAEPWNWVWNQATDKLYAAGDFPYNGPPNPIVIIAVDGRTDRLLKVMPCPWDGAEMLVSHPFRDRVYCDIAGDPGGLGFIDCTRDSLVATVTCPCYRGLSLASARSIAVDPEIDRVYLGGMGRVFVLRDESQAIEDRPGIDANDQLLECFPDPMTSALTVRFCATGCGLVKIAVFDRAGRLVKALGQAKSERAAWRWDGTDQAGSKVPAGLYFVHLTSRLKHATRKVIKVN
jgi:DNA-binding beta-propeller fold protein YncE